MKDNRINEINEYYDAEREAIMAEDYSNYDYPEMVINAKIEQLEASRRMELDALWED